MWPISRVPSPPPPELNYDFCKFSKFSHDVVRIQMTLIYLNYDKGNRANNVDWVGIHDRG